MISLIFQLVHNDTGEKYVLKVKRNNIHNELKESITHIYSLMGIVSMVTTAWLNIDITSTVVRHIDLLDEQLDFELEKMNTVTAYKNCALLDYIKIPKIYSSDTQLGPISNKYIIMEHINGIHLTEVARDDYGKYCELLIKFGFVSMLIQGNIHGDLHAGNALFIKNTGHTDPNVPEYQIGLVDFGLAISVNTRMRDAIYFVAANHRNPSKTEELVRLYLNTVMDPVNILDCIDKADGDRIVDDMVVIAHDIFTDNVTVTQKHAYELFMILSDNLAKHVVNKYGIKMNNQFVKLQVALSMSIGLSSELCEGDYNVFARDIFRKLFQLDMFDTGDDDDEEEEEVFGLDNEQIEDLIREEDARKVVEEEEEEEDEELREIERRYQEMPRSSWEPSEEAVAEA